MSEVSLLPPSASPLMNRLAVVNASAEALPVPMRDLWNPDTCPLALLPWLAWAWRVEEWSDAWPEYTKRQTVKESLLLHRRKGTVWAITRVIRLQGFSLFRLIEHVGRTRANGTVQANGWFAPGWNLGAYCYRVVLLNRNLTTEQITTLRRALNELAPARAQLRGIHFKNLPCPANGTARANGNYRCGSDYL